jgi:alanyl-tRNA synthetase
VAWLPSDVAPARAAIDRLDTWVDFAGGAVSGSGVVRRVETGPDGAVAVVADRTPFHPLDPGWPDQPGDTGSLGEARVVDCLTGAIGDDGVLRWPADLDARRGDPAYTWVVLHVVDGPAPAVGDRVPLEVDADRRATLSRGHSACHLAALALNEASARFWAKEPPRRDSRGFPFLDQIAIQESRVLPEGAYDAYRCGKSLRKAGFDAAGFLAERAAVAAEADALLAAWVASGAPSRIDSGGDPTVCGRRTWRSDVPGGPVVIPCGGTHVPDLGALGRVTVRYEPTTEGFEARTQVG